MIDMLFRRRLRRSGHGDQKRLDFNLSGGQTNMVQTQPQMNANVAAGLLSLGNGLLTH